MAFSKSSQASSTRLARYASTPRAIHASALSSPVDILQFHQIFRPLICYARCCSIGSSSCVLTTKTSPRRCLHVFGAAGSFVRLLGTADRRYRHKPIAIFLGNQKMIPNEVL